MADVTIRVDETPIRVTLQGAQGPAGAASGPLADGSVTAAKITDDAGEQAAIRDKLGLDDSLVTQQAFGNISTQSIDTNLAGSPVAADIGPVFIGHNIASADAITIDTAGAFPPGIAFRRAAGTLAAPTVVTSGLQIGYLDFRAYNDSAPDDQFFNCASIDVKVNSGLSFAAGEPPRTGMHFFITGNNDQAKEAMSLLPHGGTDGFMGAFGYLEVSGGISNPPRSSGTPRLFAATRLNTYALIVDGRPDSGLSYGQRIDLNGATAADYFFSGWSGTGGGYSQKISIRGNGDLNTLGVVRVGTDSNPAFAVDPQFVVRTTKNEWGFALTADPATGAAYGARFHLLPETQASYGFGVSSGAGTGTFKYSVRGNGDTFQTGNIYIGVTKVIGAQGAAVPDLTTTATAGTLPTANGTITIANAAAPTVVELLEYCVELEAKVETLLARLRASTGHGLIAT